MARWHVLPGKDTGVEGMGGGCIVYVGMLTFVVEMRKTLITKTASVAEALFAGRGAPRDRPPAEPKQTGGAGKGKETSDTTGEKHV